MFGSAKNNKNKIEKNQLVKEGPCIFPFKHKSKTYNECMDSEKGKKCATEVSKYGTMKKYGYCRKKSKKKLNIIKKLPLTYPNESDIKYNTEYSKQLSKKMELHKEVKKKVPPYLKLRRECATIEEGKLVKKPTSKKTKKKRLSNYKKTLRGKVYNVNTDRIVNYSKTGVKNIQLRLEKLYKNGEIEKDEYDKLIKLYSEKLNNEESQICENKGNLWCIKEQKCVKDTIKGRLTCEYILTDEQMEQVMKEPEEGKYKRKKTDYQYTEYLFAVALKNPDLPFDIRTMKYINNVHMTPTQKDGFIKDLEDSYIKESKYIQKWYANACSEIKNLYELYPELIDISNCEVFLTGKNITDSRLKSHLDKSLGRDKINKGDIYLLGKNDLFLGFSIKKSKDATLINWSIEEQFKKFKKSEYERLKEVKKEFMTSIGIEIMSSSQYQNMSSGNRKLYEAIRDKFNKSMKGDNLYKNTIKDIIETNQTYFLNEIISGIGAITSYPTYIFDGNNLANLNNIYSIYKTKLDQGKLTLLSDNKKNNDDLKQLGLKQHYSDNAGKIWYYINEDGEFKYRFEIRVKGNPYASLQFQLHKI
jgi:hypothetical protein